jgi:hypothetical protein
MKKGIFTLGLVCPLMAFSHNYSEANNFEIYILQEGETLSDVLYKNNFKPLYGKNNWVEKVLDMNHLKTQDAAKIKKGYPIILPRINAIADTKKEIKIDQVTTQMSSTVYHGLVGNRISDHQQIFIDFALFETNTQLSNLTMKQQSNFKLGLTYEDQNNRKYNNFGYRPHLSLYGISHGAGQFKQNNDLTATFQPTLQAQTGVFFNHSSIDYEFGPYAELLERSMVEVSNDNVLSRRDRMLNIGAMAKKTYETGRYIFHVRAQIGSTLFSENTSGSEGIRTVSSKFSADVNLTRDYFIGAFWQNEQFLNTEIENSNSIGLNLSYFVK